MKSDSVEKIQEPIISNTGKSTYQRAKYIAIFLPTFAKSGYTVDSTKLCIKVSQYPQKIENFKTKFFLVHGVPMRLKWWENVFFN